ncbi:MAG: hypothetical protein RMY29_014510 [Nostoc sp. CreGUA01]
MKTTKYVTRKKRISQLETEIEQLKKQIVTLTQLLDDVNGILIRSRPGLARSIEQGFHEELLPSELPASAKKPPRRKIPNLSIAPRADLVMERDSNGRLIIKGTANTSSPRPQA